MSGGKRTCGEIFAQETFCGREIDRVAERDRDYEEDYRRERSRLSLDQYGNWAINPWAEMKERDLVKLLSTADQNIEAETAKKDIKLWVPHKWSHLNAFIYKIGNPWLRDANGSGLEWVWQRGRHIPPKWTALVSSYVIPTVTRGEKRLCLAVYDPPREDFPDLRFQSHYLLGGTVEKGENPLAGALREASEEAGVVLSPSSLSLLEIQHLPGFNPKYPDRIIYYYTLEGKEAERDWKRLIREGGDGELGGAVWVDREDNRFEKHVRDVLKLLPGW